MTTQTTQQAYDMLRNLHPDDIVIDRDQIRLRADYEGPELRLVVRAVDLPEAAWAIDDPADLAALLAAAPFTLITAPAPGPETVCPMCGRHDDGACQADLDRRAGQTEDCPLCMRLPHPTPGQWLTVGERHTLVPIPCPGCGATGRVTYSADGLTYRPA
jgi:hypothetical protein